jgi:hypothetical protein
MRIRIHSTVYGNICLRIYYWACYLKVKVKLCYTCSPCISQAYVIFKQKCPETESKLYFFILTRYYSFFFFFVSEISKVRGNLFQINGYVKEPLILPDGNGPPVIHTEKVYVPVKDHPEVIFYYKSEKFYYN